MSFEDETKTKSVRLIAYEYMYVYVSLVSFFVSLVSFFVFMSVCKRLCIKQGKHFPRTNVPSHKHPIPWVNQFPSSSTLPLLSSTIFPRQKAHIYLCLPELAAVGLAVHETLPRGVGLVDDLLKWSV